MGNVIVGAVRFLRQLKTCTQLAYSQFLFARLLRTVCPAFSFSFVFLPSVIKPAKLALPIPSTAHINKSLAANLLNSNITHSQRGRNRLKFEKSVQERFFCMRIMFCSLIIVQEPHLFASDTSVHARESALLYIHFIPYSASYPRCGRVVRISETPTLGAADDGTELALSRFDCSNRCGIPYLRVGRERTCGCLDNCN